MLLNDIVWNTYIFFVQILVNRKVGEKESHSIVCAAQRGLYSSHCSSNRFRILPTLRGFFKCLFGASECRARDIPRVEWLHFELSIYLSLIENALRNAISLIYMSSECINRRNQTLELIYEVIRCWLGPILHDSIYCRTRRHRTDICWRSRMHVLVNCQYYHFEFTRLKSNVEN